MVRAARIIQIDPDSELARALAIPAPPLYLESGGACFPDLDLLIAATAILPGLTLVTRNRRHFARVPGVRQDR